MLDRFFITVTSSNAAREAGVSLGLEIKGGPQAAIHVKGHERVLVNDPPDAPISMQAHCCAHPETDRAAAALGVPLSREKPWQKAKSPLTVMLRSRDSQSIGPSHVSRHAWFSWRCIPRWERG